MAIMIPERPRSFEAASQEGLMFDALTLLPNDYYVFHSFRITDVHDNTFHESETDFVILNRLKGIICLEAKAGQVQYRDGYWLYGNGIPMHNGGPFNQASANKYKLMKYISDSNISFILKKCKFFHAVWFPAVSNERLRSMNLPSEGDKALDPKERVRFRNIISSLGSDRIVILATHIVSDISYIANEIILLNQGEIRDFGTEKEIIEKVTGKVWECEIDSDKVLETMNKFKVSNVISHAEKCRIKLVCDEKPFENAAPAEPDLEDVCLYEFGEL